MKYKCNWLGLTILLLVSAVGCGDVETSNNNPDTFLASTNSPQWIQTDWSGGGGPSTTDQYSAATGIDTTAAGQISLAKTSNWFDTDWMYRQAITITNTGAAQTNYQVRLVIPYHPAMQADFDDLRFTNADGTELDHWLQKKTDSVEAVVLVEVASLEASDDTVVYVYFGNDSASSTSSGEDTFLFFDDFDDDLIDSEKWTEVNIPADELSETGGRLVFKRLSNGSWNKAVYADTTFARGDLSFEFDYQWTINNPVHDAIMFGWHDGGTGSSYQHLVYAFYNSGYGASTTVSTRVYEDGQYRGNVSGQWVLGTDYDVRLRMRASGGAFYEWSEDSGDTWTTCYTSTYSTETDLRPGWSFHSGTHHFDNARVRKWMDPEPTTSFGATEKRYPSTGKLTSNVFDTEYVADVDWGTLTYITDGVANTEVKVRTSDESDMSGAPAFSTCEAVTKGTDISGNNCVTDGHRYIQYFLTLTSEDADSPTLQDISIGFECVPGEVSAKAGPDSIAVASRSMKLNGSASRGINLTYIWWIVEGDGALTEETTPTPTYTSAAITENQDVLIYLTVKDMYGQRSTDQMTIHVVAPIMGIEVSDIISGTVNGTPVYETTTANGDGTEQISLTVGDATIQLPHDSDGYALALVDDNRLVIGMPNADNQTGRVYLFEQPMENLSGNIQVEAAVDFGVVPEINISTPRPKGRGLLRINSEIGWEGVGKTMAVEGIDGMMGIIGNQAGDLFGQYLASGDINGNGSDEILVGAPGAGYYGAVYIYSSNLELIGVVVGSAEYPIYSIFAVNYLTSSAEDIVFRPSNRALNLNLTRGSITDTEVTKSAPILSSISDFSGLTLLDSEVADSLVGVGSFYQSITQGDINGDGHSDLVMGANDGKVYIYRGPLTPGTEVTTDEAYRIINGSSGDDRFGHMVLVGDVNGDGLNDVVIGAPDYGETKTGAVYIVFGSALWDNSIDVASSPNVCIVEGEDPNDQIGTDLLLTDADNNGIDEIYTVKASNKIYKIDLTQQPPVKQDEPEPEGEGDGVSGESSISSNSGGCSLTKDTYEVSLVILILCLVPLILLRQRGQAKVNIAPNNLLIGWI